MKYKNFSDEFWTKIQSALEIELEKQRDPVAVFDADGTLWDTDLGETFFKYQIAHSNLPDLPADPWIHYRKMKSSGDPRPAYLWLAQINKGQKFSDVQRWAQENVDQFQGLPIFESQKILIDHLQSKGVRVFIVTASVKWAVEPGARLFGLPPSQVLGVATQIENGLVTEIQDGEITYREGKWEALLKATGGVRPFLASGNSPGDISLLKGATRISLAVGATTPPHELFASEEALRADALKNGWFIHRF